MTFEIIAVFVIILAALVLFALEAFTVDFVAFGVMALLMILGLVSPEEGISGFSNPATITVMAMFILSSGLYRTGAVDLLTEKLMKFAGNSQTSQLLLVMVTVGPISAFLNNTAAVAILIPFAVKIARDHGRSPSQMLMPLSFTSQLAGVVTLIGTSTNILASSLSEDLGLGALGMFEFAHLGLIVMFAGVVYMLTIGQRLMPEREVPEEITERFHLKQYLSEVIIPEKSSFIGKSLGALKLPQSFDLEVLEIIRQGQHLRAPLVERELEAGDSLIIRTNAQDLVRLQNLKDVQLQSENFSGEMDVRGEDMELAEVLIAPGSMLIGSTIIEIDFRNRYGASVLAMSKQGVVVRQRLPETILALGDALLLKAPGRVLLSLKSDPNFIITDDMRQTTHRTNKIPLAIGIIIAVVVLAALGIWPILVTSLAGCVLMVVTGCLRIRELHQSIRWDVIFLLAGIIPLGIAMEKWGAAELLANGVVQLSQGLPGPLVLGALYFVVMILTGLISNNAAVVLMVPIAAGVATSLGLDPKAFIIAVMFAASTSFFTPVGYQTNAMIMGPGGYRFSDFIKVGGPLNIWILIVTIAAITWLWGV